METSRITNLLNNDLFIRVLSVFIAIILWAYVSFVIDPETQKEISNIPVKFLNEKVLLDSGLTLVNSEYSVSIQVEGRRNVLSNLSSDRLWADVDLSSYTKPGKIRVTAKISGLPSSVEVVKEPQDIFIELDKSHSVHKDISVTINGQPKEGYAVFNPIVKPATISIEGANNLINTIRDVTVIADVSDLENTFITKEKISIIDANGKEIKGLKSNIDSAEVVIPIVKVKEVKLNTNVTGTPAPNVILDKIIVNPEKVLITAKDDVLKEIQNLNIEPVDISDATNNIYTSSKIDIPNGVQLVNSSEMAKVEIDFKVPISKTITIDPKNISFLNKNDNYDYQILSDKIRVTVEGLEEKLNDIEQKMTVSVDVKDLQIGDNTVPLKINLPDGVNKTGDIISVKINVKNKI